MYDPKLTRAIYLRGNYFYALWDLQAKRLVARFDTSDYPIPRWSPDGEAVVIAGNHITGAFELYLIDRNGKITQLTHLNAYYTGEFFQNYSWSPDGSKIAIWLNVYPFKSGQLAILDLESGQVTNYCVPGDETAPMSALTYTAHAPIWSPDGRQVVVQNLHADRSSRVILVDIVQGWAAEIAKNMEPVGWLKAP